MSEEGRRIAEERRAGRVEALRERISGFLRNGTEPSLEIGCGHGHWLVSLAEADPRTPFVGIDLVSRRIRLAEGKVRRRGLENVLFLKAEALEAMAAWPLEYPLDRIFLLHPDPWPKKRHAKNRLTGPIFLDGMARIAAPGARLFFRTDDQPFYEWSREQIEAHPDWEEKDLPWPHEAGSYFKDLLGVHGMISAVRLVKIQR